jgi:hypothetical protein
MSRDQQNRGVVGQLWARLRGLRQWVRYIAVAGVGFFASLLFIVLARPLLAPLVGRESYGFVVLVWMLATLYVIHLYSQNALGD